MSGSVDILIWGGTGQAKVLRPILEHAGHRIAAVFDRDPTVAAPYRDLPLLSDPAGLETWLRTRSGQRTGYAVAIGGDGAARCTIADWLDARGIRPISAVHPQAWVDTSAQLGDGCQVMALAAVGVEAALGRQCIINTSASVDHECRLGDGVHVMPGATLAGCVTLGDYVMVGSNATILPRIHVGNAAFIGAGAVVTRDVGEGEVVVGNPARMIRRVSPPARSTDPFASSAGSGDAS